MPEQKVFLGVPTYDYRPYWHTFDSVAFSLAGTNGEYSLIPRNRNTSLGIGHCSNMLFTEAVNMGCDWFAMCHADIAAEAGWLGKMLAEAESVKADVLSSVMPIKDSKGDASTSVAKQVEPDFPRAPGDRVLSRFRMTDMKPDSTFCFADLSQELARDGQYLCVNTGLFVMRLKQPWTTQIYFEIRTWTGVIEDGRMACGVLPEDWNFSGLLHRLGVKPWATTKVRALHIGARAWSNDPEDYKAEAANGGPQVEMS